VLMLKLLPNDLKITFDLRQQKRARLTNGHRPSGTGSRPHVTDITHSTASSVAHSQPCGNDNAAGSIDPDPTNCCTEPVVNVATIHAPQVNPSIVHLTASTTAAATASSFSTCTATTTASSTVTSATSSAPITTVLPQFNSSCSNLMGLRVYAPERGKRLLR